MTSQTFDHQQTAHCESGVMSALLRHHGLDFNEAMVFGLASALSFAYIPLVKMAGMPLIAYRTVPKSIIRNTCKQLGIRLKMQKFADPAAGMAALDRALDAGRLVGLQTSVYWLPYFPAEMRFHFNAHNLLVYGRDGDDYLISDPVFENVQRCSRRDLQRARFAKGALAAKGLMYYVDTAQRPSENTDKLRAAVKRALLKNARQMLPPVWFAGVRGIRTLAAKVEKLPQRRDEAYAKLYLGHIVRMQEEIGTGGAGFRYIYAYFLEQAAARLNAPELQDYSQQMTAVGDQWRKFASMAVHQCRKPAADGYAAVAAQLRHIADEEEKLWRAIKRTAADL
ncbi:MAG: BtrH N-terminal domain-containing protein [Neisseria sp.]|nr:BtrH N-terminal domain-containing protein [Neisseria sp.]